MKKLLQCLAISFALFGLSAYAAGPTEVVYHIDDAESQGIKGLRNIRNHLDVSPQTTIIVVTHDEKIIPTFKRIYHIREGRTIEEAGEGRSLL